MSISKNSVVEFHYTLSENQQEIENSHSSAPLSYLHGHNAMLPGLENAIEGKEVDDKFEITLTPEEAYGERQDNLEQRIPLKHLQDGNAGPSKKKAKVWKKGMNAFVETENGRRQVTILKVGKFNADCDLNHPLAGKTLTFAIEINSVRAATEEELTHGHVHGEGGCGH
ncbi:FKBP-type peptidyl-prolyl cis-trans isomerase [Pseudoalteromonas denitrificans]|uniref:Peptidyl-prolyl cis-trans isomerase n=1 Tax=Pseudoalteromonas denitrificans DSM 6059 TaxID=1123010 RepID=A0A1I1JA99_9GAMM|nr:peptidylprolyl isomerase [Pseudoalteromonas denitrificans]SFC45051.1 FKBP-type peptidyl-prolyl cis-trans isomerase SlyD [Pseudoalteromonas denitrificans DSM 6059]